MPSTSKTSRKHVKALFMTAIAAMFAMAAALSGCGSAAPTMKATAHEGSSEVSITSAKAGEDVFVPMVFDEDEALDIGYALSSGSVKVEVVSSSSYSSSTAATYTSEDLSGEGSVTSDVIGEGSYKVRVTIVEDASGTVKLTAKVPDDESGDEADEAQSGAVLGAEMPIEDDSFNWSATSGNESIAAASSDGLVTGEDGEIEGALFTVTPGGESGSTTVTFTLAKNDDPDEVNATATWSVSVSDEDTGTLTVTDYSGPDEYKGLLKAQ